MRSDILKESGAFLGKKENKEKSAQKKDFQSSGEKQTKIDSFVVKAKKKFEDDLQKALEESKKLYEMENNRELQEINEQIDELEKMNENDKIEKTPELKNFEPLEKIPESEEEKLPEAENSENPKNSKKRKDCDPFLDGLMEKYSYKKLKNSSTFSSEDSMIEMKEFEISSEFTQLEKKLKMASQPNPSDKISNSLN